MNNILDKPTQSTTSNIELLSRDLDIKIPAKKLEKNLLIATWNIRAFGDITRKEISNSTDSPKRDYHSVLCIAEIIKRFDVVAIQEVKANIKGLRDTMKVLGSNWALILTDVNKGNVGNDERMAYIFDIRRVQLSGLACELVVPQEWIDKASDKALTEQFVRSPYAVSFKSFNQTFILVTLHIKYGKSSKDRIKELGGIAQWMAEWAKDVNVYHQNLLCLGDFNIDERGDLLNQTFIAGGLHIPEELQKNEVTRSIFDETKFYDQIAWFNNANNIPNLSLKYKTAGNYNFVEMALINRNLKKQALSFMLSDHLPLWVEFEL
jgi:exonuclease III